MIFQNPYASLDPRWSVFHIVAEPLVTHRVVPRRELRQRVSELLDAVGLDPSATRSAIRISSAAGSAQRIGLARALALDPKLLVADEPVSALDVSVQAQILNMLRAIQRRYALSILFISHDLSVVRFVCDRVGVMYLGEMVELAETASALPRAPPSLHAGAAGGDPRAHDPAPAHAGADRGRDPKPDRPSRRLPLPPALPARRGDLPYRAEADVSGARAQATTAPATSPDAAVAG